MALGATTLLLTFLTMVSPTLRDLIVNVSDLDLVSAIAFIRGKGQDDKELIHLHPETVKALKLYLKTNKIADGVLFKSLGNRKSYRITTITMNMDHCFFGARRFIE